MDDGITPQQAQEALEVARDAGRRVASEVGLPRAYWWALAAGWVTLGLLGEIGPAWLAAVFTTGFAMGHSVLASRLLDGRRRTGRVQVSTAVAGRRIAGVVVAMLLVLVCITVAAGMALHADGTQHAGAWAAVLVAAVVGFGGPEMLRVLRGWVRA